MTRVTSIELTTGAVSYIEAGNVQGETIARIAPWLGAALSSGVKTPLPYSQLAGSTALAAAIGGALVVTISGSANGLGKAPSALVTMGVVKDQRGGDQLWPEISKGTLGARVAPGLQQPKPAWCAVSPWPKLALHPEADLWLAEIAKSIAWVWIEQDICNMRDRDAPRLDRCRSLTKKTRSSRAAPSWAPDFSLLRRTSK